MLGKSSLIRPAWRPAGAHASRHAPWTSHVHGVRFESLSAPETHGKQGTTLLDTLRSVDSIEEPATEMVLDLKQIVSINIVESHTHNNDTARDCSLLLEGFDHIRSHAQTASRLEEELGRESTECFAVGTPLDTPRVQCTLSERVESPISNRANAVQAGEAREARAHNSGRRPA